MHDALARRALLWRRYGGLLLAAALATASMTACVSEHDANAERPVRIGYLNNITHVQALVSIAQDNLLGRVSELGEIEMRAFNVGPAAIDAMASGDLDAAYVGPTGALNAYYRTKGELIAIVAGAASGGARLMVSAESGISSPRDFSGRTIATPGIGNTQDVSLRTWLTAQGLKPREQGGTVSVRPIANPDIFQLMMRGRLDAAWVPEPWATRLEAEAGATTFLDERSLWPDGQFSSVTLAVSRNFLESQPEKARRLVEAHAKITSWVLSNRDAAIADANLGLERSLGKALDPGVASTAFDHFTVTADPITPSIAKMAGEMLELEYLPRGSNVDAVAALFELGDLKATGVLA
ncbi:MAG: sulfonate ABC transporter substrate-binding protein [Acidobacteria bacterium]|nr:MAG: sulfonate ABC transporter substrate-binding protein [Acidobacteriota bacterium]